MSVTVLIVAMALVTLAERASFLLLKDRLSLPAWLERALIYVPAAVLSALVAPAVASTSGVAVGPFDVRLVAAALAALVAWSTRSVIATLSIGMGSLWALSWLLG